MNRDEIIRMAREAGFTQGDLSVFPDLIVHFAALVAAAEREACAKVCEELRKDLLAGAEDYASGKCIDAIRARGEK